MGADWKTNLSDYIMKKEITKEEKLQVQQMNMQADKIMFRFLMVYALFGIAISFYYDTWVIGLSVAGLAIASWFVTKALLPNHALHRYVSSAFLGVFVGSFIYQMHGLFEMHFFAFIGSAILIVYQDWKLQIPLISFVVVHHAVFAYLQYSGVPDIYFTQLQYMDLHTFVFHAGLAATVVIVCGYWAHRFRRMTIQQAVKSHQIAETMKETEQLNAKLQKLSQALKTKNQAIESKNKELEESKTKLIGITERQAQLYKEMREGKMLG
jgi:hypothetical protein